MSRSAEELAQPWAKLMCLGLGLLFMGKQLATEATLEVCCGPHSAHWLPLPPARRAPPVAGVCRPAASSCTRRQATCALRRAGCRAPPWRGLQLLTTPLR